jgi:hypothetical protein
VGFNPPDNKRFIIGFIQNLIKGENIGLLRRFAPRNDIAGNGCQNKKPAQWLALQYCYLLLLFVL